MAKNKNDRRQAGRVRRSAMVDMPKRPGWGTELKMALADGFLDLAMWLAPKRHPDRAILRHAMDIYSDAVQTRNAALDEVEREVAAEVAASMKEAMARTRAKMTQEVVDQVVAPLEGAADRSATVVGEPADRGGFPSPGAYAPPAPPPAAEAAPVQAEVPPPADATPRPQEDPPAAPAVQPGTVSS